MLLVGVFLGREAQAFYNPSTGRWLSRDPIGETVVAPSLYAFMENAPVNKGDLLGNASFPLTDQIKEMVDGGKVYNCHIVIYVGHNRIETPHVPQPRISKCGYASVVACFSSTIPVDSPIPGIEPRPDEYTRLNYNQAAAMADRDYAAGIAAAKGLCGGSCCCKKVLIWINCAGVDIGISTALKGVCNKWTELDCKTGATTNGGPPSK